MPARAERPGAKMAGLTHDEIRLKPGSPHRFLSHEISDPQKSRLDAPEPENTTRSRFERFILPLIALEICALNHTFKSFFCVAQRSVSPEPSFSPLL
jgi:hypothetical protein